MGPLVLACALLLGLSGRALAQGSAADIEAALAAEGFENLSVTEEAGGRELRIAFENRRYRWKLPGWGWRWPLPPRIMRAAGGLPCTRRS